ncbi:MAG TPA: helix-turn-helix transcriptional regulator [Xanthobacteraceae bacterium]
MSLGKTIRQLRLAARLSQEKLGERADLHPTYISLLERDRKSPTVTTLRRLAKALGTTPSQILRSLEC